MQGGVVQSQAVDVASIFEAQSAHQWAIRQSTAGERIAKLRRLHRAIVGQMPGIARALATDLGKPKAEAIATEIYPVLQELRHTMRHLSTWMRPRRVCPPLALLGCAGTVRREPKGVVLVISPWNYPFMLSLDPVISAVAAGNCVTLKPSEFSPATSQLLGQLVASVFAEAEVAVLEGGAELAETLVAMPFDHIFFTGGTATGRKVMSAAAETMASVTLELGGKSPAVVLPGADLTLAASRIAWGKFMNAGQTCVAPDYCLVPRAEVEPFVRAVCQSVDTMYGADRSRRAGDVARIASARHLSRLRDMLDEAVAGGARVAAMWGPLPDSGSKQPWDETTPGAVVRAAATDLYMPPVVLTDPPPQSRLMQEEIFGPILPIVPYDSLGEAVAIARALGDPLALYVFGRERSGVEQVLANIKSGDAMVNGTILHVSSPMLPFGGRGASGTGKAHGLAGFMEFTHERSILKVPKLSTAKVLAPPYTSVTEALMAAIARWL